ncbi:MAG: radical SAM protein [Candidatus Brockarchaeota archaeon]|nr:radical SAM protein [Candidatus Brockarchaeota archaeon]
MRTAQRGTVCMTDSRKLAALCRLGRWDAADSEAQRTTGFGFQKGSDSERNGGAKELELEKVWTLGEGTERDNCGWSNSGQNLFESIAASGAFRAATPRGSCTLLKTLYTNACNSDCAYCINSNRSRETYSYTPEELARVFNQLHQRKMVQGLFLSSAMGADQESTMDEMIQAVEILRARYAYKGYVHLKILPGSSRYQVKRAVDLADRVSLNVEEPSGSRLAEVSTTKDYEIDILRRQAWVKELAPRPAGGQATQLVVGAAEETDREIVDRMRKLYEEASVRRVHYSAFEPVPGTRLQDRRAAPSWRERRLYQVDWLYRVYRFPMEEILEALVGDFLPNRDPKIALARLRLERPLEVNDASREELLRVPGIGPKSANRILSLQRKGVRIRSRRQLAEAGVVLGRALPFIKLDGNRQETLKGWL